jgi:hypothetical protein
MFRTAAAVGTSSPLVVPRGPSLALDEAFRPLLLAMLSDRNGEDWLLVAEALEPKAFAASARSQCSAVGIEYDAGKAERCRLIFKAAVLHGIDSGSAYHRLGSEFDDFLRGPRPKESKMGAVCELLSLVLATHKGAPGRDVVTLVHCLRGIPPEFLASGEQTVLIGASLAIMVSHQLCLTMHPAPDALELAALALADWLGLPARAWLAEGLAVTADKTTVDQVTELLPPPPAGGFPPLDTASQAWFHVLSGELLQVLFMAAASGPVLEYDARARQFLRRGISVRQALVSAAAALLRRGEEEEDASDSASVFGWSSASQPAGRHLGLQVRSQASAGSRTSVLSDDDEGVDPITALSNVQWECGQLALRSEPVPMHDVAVMLTSRFDEDTLRRAVWALGKRPPAGRPPLSGNLNAVLKHEWFAVSKMAPGFLSLTAEGRVAMAGPRPFPDTVGSAPAPVVLGKVVPDPSSAAAELMRAVVDTLLRSPAHSLPTSMLGTSVRVLMGEEAYSAAKAWVREKCGSRTTFAAMLQTLSARDYLEPGQSIVIRLDAASSEVAIEETAVMAEPAEKAGSAVPPVPARAHDLYCVDLWDYGFASSARAQVVCAAVNALVGTGVMEVRALRKLLRAEVERETLGDDCLEFLERLEVFLRRNAVGMLGLGATAQKARKGAADEAERGSVARSSASSLYTGSSVRSAPLSFAADSVGTTIDELCGVVEDEEAGGFVALSHTGCRGLVVAMMQMMCRREFLKQVKRGLPGRIELGWVVSQLERCVHSRVLAKVTQAESVAIGGEAVSALSSHTPLFGLSLGALGDPLLDGDLALRRMVPKAPLVEGYTDSVESTPLSSTAKWFLDAGADVAELLAECFPSDAVRLEEGAIVLVERAQEATRLRLEGSMSAPRARTRDETVLLGIAQRQLLSAKGGGVVEEAELLRATLAEAPESVVGAVAASGSLGRFCADHMEHVRLELWEKGVSVVALGMASEDAEEETPTRCFGTRLAVEEGQFDEFKLGPKWLSWPRYVCAFGNQFKGGKVWIGVDDGGRVIGVPLTSKQKDTLLNDIVMNVCDRVTPRLGVEDVTVSFLPVHSPRGATLTDFERANPGGRGVWSESGECLSVRDLAKAIDAGTEAAGMGRVVLDEGQLLERVTAMERGDLYVVLVRIGCAVREGRMPVLVREEATGRTYIRRESHCVEAKDEDCVRLQTRFLEEQNLELKRRLVVAGAELMRRSLRRPRGEV